MSDRLSELRNLLEKDPHDAFCMYGIAMEYSKSGNHTEAIAWFDLTMEVDPAYSYAWYHKARVQEESGNTAGAMQTLEDGIIQADEIGDTHAVEEMKDLMQHLS
jgi:tetratricopeptide (TPR) repeat protein